MNWKQTHSIGSAWLLASLLCLNSFGYNVTNTVVTVDQNGQLNVEGIASVQDVATNAAKAAVAEQKAVIAYQASVATSNSIQTVVVNLMANNEVIYRSGLSDSFAPLVIFVEGVDKFAISEVKFQNTSSTVSANIKYVCTQNIGMNKPTVMHRAQLSGGPRTDFLELPAANVSQPVFHSGSYTFMNDTFSGYYEIDVTVPNPVSTASYFMWIKVELDSPSGDGSTLDLPNGVTGGVTGTVTWGDKELTFKGGMLMSVQEAE